MDREWIVGRWESYVIGRSLGEIRVYLDEDWGSVLEVKESELIFGVWYVDLDVID